MRLPLLLSQSLYNFFQLPSNHILNNIDICFCNILLSNWFPSLHIHFRGELLYHGAKLHLHKAISLITVLTCQLARPHSSATNESYQEVKAHKSNNITTIKSKEKGLLMSYMQFIFHLYGGKKLTTRTKKYQEISHNLCASIIPKKIWVCLFIKTF